MFSKQHSIKHLFLLLIIIFVTITVEAQLSLEKTLLWQITGPGITTPSYLYGTIHLMCKEDIIVSTELRARFYQTKQLYLELDMDDPAVLTKTMTGMNMKNDTTLKQLLTPAQYDSVATEFKQLTNLPLDMMQKMKPEMVETVIYPSLLGCEGAQAWEQKFMQLAKANNMSIHGLEDVEDQIKIFDEIPYKVQAEELRDALLHIDSIKTSFNKMLEVYKHKDLNALSQMMNDENEFAEYSDLLISNRNKKWIGEIIEQAKQQPTFFAVGAGHLANENGLINLLRKNGYTITAVMY